MNLVFDGYDAIMDGDKLVYDGLDSRSAEIIIRLTESFELAEARIAELKALIKQLSDTACAAADGLVAERSRVAELEATVESQGEYIDELEKDVEMLVRHRRGLGDPSLARQTKNAGHCS